MKPSQDKTRLVEAVEHAENLFWNAIASDYPEITSGDFPPDLSMEMSDKLTQFVTVWLKMNEPEPKPSRVTEILLHRIEYNYDEDMELTDGDEEHIAYQISQGMREGELSTLVPVTNEKFDRSVRGYWRINNV